MFSVCRDVQPCFFFSQLVIGDPSMDIDQSKTQFAIWAIMAAVSTEVFVFFYVPDCA